MADYPEKSTGKTSPSKETRSNMLVDSNLCCQYLNNTLEPSPEVFVRTDFNEVEADLHHLGACDKQAQHQCSDFPSSRGTDVAAMAAT